jgi:hypothetical protein
MWAGRPAMPSPGDPQAEPTIGKAINGGFDLIEAKCNRCDRIFEENDLIRQADRADDVSVFIFWAEV